MSNFLHFLLHRLLMLKTLMLVIGTYLVGYIPTGSFKKRSNDFITKHCFGVLSGALSLSCKYHNRENLPQNGICVANHTSPMDALVLACDNTYDLVRQPPTEPAGRMGNRCVHHPCNCRHKQMCCVTLSSDGRHHSLLD